MLFVEINSTNKLRRNTQHSTIYYVLQATCQLLVICDGLGKGGGTSYPRFHTQPFTLCLIYESVGLFCSGRRSLLVVLGITRICFSHPYKPRSCIDLHVQTPRVIASLEAISNSCNISKCWQCVMAAVIAYQHLHASLLMAVNSHTVMCFYYSLNTVITTSITRLRRRLMHVKYKLGYI